MNNEIKCQICGGTNCVGPKNIMCKDPEVKICIDCYLCWYKNGPENAEELLKLRLEEKDK